MSSSDVQIDKAKERLAVLHGAAAAIAIGRLPTYAAVRSPRDRRQIRFL